jgi:hypothetical protein
VDAGSRGTDWESTVAAVQLVVVGVVAVAGWETACRRSEARVEWGRSRLPDYFVEDILAAENWSVVVRGTHSPAVVVAVAGTCWLGWAAVADYSSPPVVATGVAAEPCCTQLLTGRPGGKSLLQPVPLALQSLESCQRVL